MGAGKYSARVTFYRMTEGARDATGQPVVVWSVLAPRWGNIRMTPGKEAIAAGRVEDTATATLRVQADSLTELLTGRDAVVAKGRLWIIKGIAVATDRDREIDLRLETGADLSAELAALVDQLGLAGALA